jgi:hypothetical protein
MIAVMRALTYLGLLGKRQFYLVNIACGAVMPFIFRSSLSEFMVEPNALPQAIRTQNLIMFYDMLM